MDVDALIAKARAHFDSVEPVTQDVAFGDDIVGVRLWPMTGPDWRDLIVKYPPREGVVLDTTAGYNVDAVTAVYPKVYLVQGDDVTNVADRWPQICPQLSGPDLKNLATAIWGLNEYQPQKRLVDAGKASKGEKRKKRSSPAN